MVSLVCKGSALVVSLVGKGSALVVSLIGKGSAMNTLGSRSSRRVSTLNK